MIEDKPAPALDMNALASLIKDATIEATAELRDKLSEIEGRLDQQVAATPRLVKMEAPESLADARRAAFSGGNSEGGMNYPITSDGERIDMRFMKCRFKAGDAVRINPKVAKEGFPRAGDPFPDKYEVDTKGKKRITSDWRKWSKLFADQPDSGGEFPRDVLWGDILAMSKNAGEGVVKSRPFLGKTGLWKLKVRVKGMTDKAGDGFYENELLSA
jgi:hypothetical protein